jgi:pyruvate dehydrogenase E2 component (dihydrolipoamide acetyltransferase)
VFISPRARRLAESHSLQWKGLTGTGPDGAIVTRDVRAAIGSAGPAQRKVRERTPLTGVRALTAKRMQESAATTVPVTLTTEVDATGLSARRRELRELGQTVSYNDLLIQLVARTLREHPRLNASLVDDHIHYWDEVHVGLAVDSDRGLLVPVVRNADEKPLSAIAAETGARVADARAGRLAADQVGNATFTITNLGMFGIDAFTPVIPLPECAILGVGRIRPQPAVVNGELRVRERTWLSLTFDHRLVDGGPAARFLQALCRRIETLVPDE